jgi:hypothetical protein
MDDLAPNAIQVLLILLPGFFAARVVEALTVRPSQTELDKIIEALFYSFFIYFVCVAVIGINPLVMRSMGSQTSSTIRIDVGSLRAFIVYDFVLALVLGIVVSYSTTNDTLTGLFRLIGVTRRTSRISIWSDVFHDVDEFVVVEFIDGRRVRGWPRLFSDTPDENSLFLERASWIRDDGTPVEINGAGILITKNLPIQTIAFIGGGVTIDAPST